MSLLHWTLGLLGGDQVERNGKAARKTNTASSVSCISIKKEMVKTDKKQMGWVSQECCWKYLRTRATWYNWHSEVM